VLDTVVAAETPEGIVLELHPAGLPARFYAFILDWIIRLVIMYAIAMIAGILGGVGVAFWLILLFALEWFYPIVFELGRSGATPGKKTFGLKGSWTTDCRSHRQPHLLATCCALLTFFPSATESPSSACCYDRTANASVTSLPPHWLCTNRTQRRGSRWRR
jgi:hypothetical protein